MTATLATGTFQRETGPAFAARLHPSRYLGVLFAAGAALGYLSLVAPHSEQINEVGVSLTASAAAVIAAALWIWGDHIGPAVLHGVVVLGSAIITLAVYFGGDADASGTTAIFYVWVSLFAFTFLDRADAGRHVAVVAIAYGTVLAITGDRENVGQWIIVLGTVVVSGYGVERLVRHNTHLAAVDSLSGLPNRRRFDEVLSGELQAAQRRHSQLAVGIIDLDQFKIVNDTLGHVVGDDLLRLCAERLKASVRGEDFIARLGGDEFGIIIKDDIALEPRRLARRVAEAFSEPFTLRGHQLAVRTSMGFATVSPDSSASDVLRHADLAMYAAKSSDARQYEIFDPSMLTRAIDELDLETELRKAITRREIGVAFQPIVVVSTGEVRAVEALAQWHHPTRGNIPSSIFIPIAERTGAIHELGQQVIEQACDAAVRLHAAEPDVCVSLTLSPAQLLNPGLVADIARIVRRTGVPPEKLVFEISEAALMKVSPDARLLHELKKLGVRIAIDEFGVAYASLSYLRNVPVDILKLDKAFIKTPGHGVGHLARAVIELGKSLGLEVVAAGIESPFQLEEFRSLGCGIAQSFLFASPMPESDLLDYLASQERPIATGTREATECSHTGTEDSPEFSF